MKRFASILLCVAANTAAAQATPTVDRRMVLPDLRREQPFDGIDVPRYAEFWNTWHLVTVRFRKDNGEQRFIYANDIAFRAIRTHARTYPDGAMFGKIAFTVEDDASFPNSEEPRGFTRVQLMRKDAARYATHDGWGYAIFVRGSGIPYGDEPNTVAACHACHKLVPERDFVFSSPSFLGAGFVPSAMQSIAFRSRFRDESPATLGTFERLALSHIVAADSIDRVARVRSLRMELFAGSVDESMAAMARFAAEDRVPYALWDAPHREFVVAVPQRPVPGCALSARVAATPGAVLHRAGDKVENPRPRVESWCDGKRMR